MAQGMTIIASIKIRQAADIIYISVTFIKVMVFNQVKHKVSVNTLYINVMVKKLASYCSRIRCSFVAIKYLVNIVHTCFGI